jgi:L-ribulokinase
VSAPFVIGVDFGTVSARALVVDMELGREAGSCEAGYRQGVIDERLPGGARLAGQWALQDPDDWLLALEQAVGGAIASARVEPSAVVGLALDFTSCTVLPTARDGAPLCRRPELRNEPHAWPKLWKHHAAQSQADEITELAAARAEPWLGHYGGRVSSEWLLPKAMQALDEAPGVFAAADLIVEGGDWVAWQLSGELRRNACAAGFKGLWSKRGGYPDDDFLAALRPELRGFHTGPGRGDVAGPGTRLGELGETWAHRLGLPAGIAVAVGIVDAHAGLLGAGVHAPGALYLAAGTSTCHLLLSGSDADAPGISGVVEDGILPGLFAYEAGQASVGDMFEWCAQLVGQSQRELIAAGSALAPGSSGLLALDWWNGCRTPLVDAELAGVVLGLTLATSPAALYRALLEASAFGTRLVIDTFAASGIATSELVVGGGLTRNELLLQLYADVTGCPLTVCASAQPSALGAAMLAATAAGAFPSLSAAIGSTARPPLRTFEPAAAATAVYDELYDLYHELVLTAGASGAPLKRLAAIRSHASRPMGRPVAPGQETK